MSAWFASPWGLLGLLAVPAILAIHLYHRRYPRLEVAGLHLWSADAETRSAGRRRERLPITATLLLELLLALILGLLLAHPRIASATTGVHLVVVLDSSASMSAGAPGKPSFRDAAIAELRNRAEQAGRGSLATLILSGPRPELLAGPAVPWDEALAALTKWQPQRPVHDFRPAWDLAVQLDEDAGLLFLTDHRPAVAVPASMEVVAVGQPVQNLAISAARWALGPAGGDGELFLRVASYSPVALSPELTITSGDRELLRQTVTVPASGSTPLKIALPGGTGQVEVKLNAASDALPLDSQVVLIEPVRRPLTVAQLLPEDYPGRGAVADMLSGLDDVQPGAVDQAHLIIAPASGEPPLNPETWWLGLGPVQLEEAARKQSRDLLGPYILEKSHPLLEEVVLGGVVWGGAQSPQRSLRPLISAGNLPLLGELEESGGTAWLLNIDLSRSNLTESPDWPILLSNLLRLRRDSLPGLRRFNYRMNETIRFRMPVASTDGRPLDGEQLELVRGKQRRQLAPGRFIELPPLDDAGVYVLEGRVKDGGTAVAGRLAANFFDAAESDLQGLNSSSIPVDSTATETRIDSSYTWAAVLGLAAVLLLAFSDWFVLRRSPA
ncbi:MAG: BatA and WFA domain-containing protein [Planctomycetaceae bacterium]|nr:BatA and WFA domain-containing protein [Planctomycetaceae bacterium]